MAIISIPTGTSQGSGTTAFATCIDTKSTLLLEFQGVVEMDGPTWAGNPLGQLSILPGGDKAQLVIGNHRLDGKVVKLDKSLLLIQKQRKPTVVTNQSTSPPTSLKASDKSNDSMHEVHDDQGYRLMLPDSQTAGDEDAPMISLNSLAGGVADPTATYMGETIQYDTVAIIRQKILFNTMPTPIIHTERRGLTVIKRGV
ncbi:hypothetical protein EDD11_000766 [Mortierella claussenii]|nr:hypothetical protein EDD11_000766 [Mortierella claussenii]